MIKSDQLSKILNMLGDVDTSFIVDEEGQAYCKELQKGLDPDE